MGAAGPVEVATGVELVSSRGRGSRAQRPWHGASVGATVAWGCGSGKGARDSEVATQNESNCYFFVASGSGG